VLGHIWGLPKEGGLMKEKYILKCSICGSEDIRLPKIGISFGMYGFDFNFCSQCLFGMTADEMWGEAFKIVDIHYPPILADHIQKALDQGIDPDEILPPAPKMNQSNLVPAKRRSRPKISERGKMTNSLRYDVLKRDGFYCQICGATGKEDVLVVDHIKPVSKGGKTEKDNLQTLCQTCNSGKAAKV
jgi:hypothetical protein